MTRRVWVLPCLVALATMLALVSSDRAAAHPLGNFTINHYSRLEFADGAVRIKYVLDLAEIPTFQRMGKLDTDGDGSLSDTEAINYLDAELPSLVAGLQMKVGNDELPLRVLDRSAALLPGQGGLRILRIEARLAAELRSGWEENGAGYYTDRNYEDRIGWREIVIRGGSGVAIENSTAPSADVSNELRSYPADSLSSPLDRREATFTLVPGNGPTAGETASRAAASVKSTNNGGTATSRVASLISVERPTPGIILLTFLGALFWGATHALSPGHGKTVVAAYLVGSRGTARHAAFLGLVVTLTHTIGVFALGGVTLYLSRYILPEVLYPWLSVVSGLLVVAIGLSLVRSRTRDVFASGRSGGEHAYRADAHGIEPHSHSHGGHQHSHPDDHSTHVHPHGTHAHNHLPPGADGSAVTWRSLLALGVSGGLVPCPSALVLLLSAISLGRVGFGILLVVVFSLGLAAVLTGIGILLVYARHLFDRFAFEARVPRLLSVASAVAISLAGLLIVIGSLRQTGVF